jgi:hypothetical protein
MGLTEVAMAAQFIAQSNGAYGPQREPGIPPRDAAVVWLAQPGNLIRAIVQAREHRDKASERCADWQEAMAAMGMASTKIT